MPDAYDEYVQAAERDPVPGALRAAIEAQGAAKALRALADDLDANFSVRFNGTLVPAHIGAAEIRFRADRIEREGHL